jgi:2-polyprenyl-3-methyl-5-hydroxy-6-metoxy-1,4-benzoquinol methylase
MRRNTGSLGVPIGEATQQPEATASQRHGSLHALSFRDDGALVELRRGNIGGVNRKGQKARIPTGLKVREERVGRRDRVTSHEGLRHRVLLGLLARVVFRANEARVKWTDAMSLNNGFSLAQSKMRNVLWHDEVGPCRELLRRRKMALRISRSGEISLMSVVRSILIRMFGRPKGILGRVGGIIMARSNQKCAAWVIDLLDIQPNDSVLEVGFGPGVGIQLLARSASAGYVAGIDYSEEMVEQATARNAKAIERGRVDLRHGSVESSSFEDNTFDKALAINSMQVWPDAGAGLREMRRVIKPGSGIALGFTPYSGQPKSGLPEMLTAAGFTEVHLVEAEEGFCALAIKPRSKMKGHDRSES